MTHKQKNKRNPKSLINVYEEAGKQRRARKTEPGAKPWGKRAVDKSAR